MAPASSAASAAASASASVLTQLEGRALSAEKMIQVLRRQIAQIKSKKVIISY